MTTTTNKTKQIRAARAQVRHFARLSAEGRRVERTARGLFERAIERRNAAPSIATRAAVQTEWYGLDVARSLRLDREAEERHARDRLAALFG